jgi:xylan 1,4-beta-xylosidase
MQNVEIRVDPGCSLGPIKPLHGVNNGPISQGGLTDCSEAYREAGFPFVRLHDCEWPNPFRVDVPKIFPRFEADPDDPANYLFKNTDELIEAIYRTGAEPIYRLGVSIEHMPDKLFAVPPKDFEKWADICIHIIRHYNEGWAGGAHYGIRYWEIWNEPDGRDCMWYGGTAGDYYRLYVTASKRIKAACPDILVGGYAATSVHNEEYVRGFLQACREAGAPLDFFSWHQYSQGSNVEVFPAAARQAQAYLREYGYPDALSICDEWNYMAGQDHWELRGKTDPESALLRREYFGRQRNMVGASFCAAVLAEWQNSPLDAAAYYDAQPHMQYCGLFDLFEVRQKTFFAFKAFGELYRLGGVQVAAELRGGSGGVYALAARSGGRAAVLLVNHDGEDARCMLQMDAIAQNCGVRSLMLDESHDLEPVKTEQFHGGKMEWEVLLPSNTVCLVCVEETQGYGVPRNAVPTMD